MDDFEAPSFSLGLDLDVDSEPPTAPREKPLDKLDQPSSSNVNFEAFEGHEKFQPKFLDLDLEVSPPVLKRLRRGPPTQSHGVGKREAVRFSPNIDEDTGEFSSQEDPHRDELPSLQNCSALSSPKLPLHAPRVLTTQSVNKLNEQKRTPTSVASSSTSLEVNNNKLMFPKLTVGPLRRFQLLDSDSDDPSASQDVDATDAAAKDRYCTYTQPVTKNEQKKTKFSESTLKSEDLWKDFSSKKNISIPTPALDEFCKEYFSSMNDKNVTHKQECVYDRSSKSCYQKSSVSKKVEHFVNPDNSLPPARQYFYHDDPRIQELVRTQLPNFFPLGTVNDRANKQADVADIDYISQFGHRECPTQFHGTWNRGLEKSSKRTRNDPKNAKAKEASQSSENWLNPKSCAAIPRDAGKRRVCAGGHSACHWFTGQDGRKVYVTKNGQKLTGRIAYRHYKKESRGAFKTKRSRKKATFKKKSKR